MRTTSSKRPGIRRWAVALVGLLLLGACEARTVNRVNEVRDLAGLAPATVSDHLRQRARDRAVAMCQEGTASASSDLPTDYLGEPTTALVELVGSAPLDPTITDAAERRLAAADVVWAQWQGAPELVDPRWESIGVGEHDCPDGHLYVAMVLRDDAPDLADPAATDAIVAAEVVSEDGWTWRRYRNLAAPCAISGFQSFVIGTEDGSDPEATAPLWVRLRGGGVGYFDGDGNPQPGTHNKSEESMETQLGFADSGLLLRATSSGRGFRVLIVSMCSHDVYAGNDNYDPYNPNLTPSGTTRPTTGLSATKAAIQFTLATHPTDHHVLHGTSAGGYGVYNTAWALQRQGTPPVALVSDSGVLNRAWLSYVEDNGIGGSAGCEKNTEERSVAVMARVDHEVADPLNQPHLLIEDGRLEVPAMHVWNQGDYALCGDVPIQCPLPDGSTVTLWAADCQHEPMRLAIAALGPENPSASMRLCVEGPRPEPCDRHVPTRSNQVNTDPGAPADYNGAILDWVLERIDEADG